MAEREGGSSATPWIAFLVGIVLIALVAVGYFATTNRAPQEQAKLEVNMPDVPRAPDVDLPEAPPAPTLPPAAEAPVDEAPATPTPAEPATTP